jgi:hypothetical protein
MHLPAATAVSFVEPSGISRTQVRKSIMTGLGKTLALAAAVGGLAAPAAAQYYPPQPYPQPYPQTYPPGYPQSQYGYNNNQSGIGQIIDQLLGNRYNVSDRSAVSRCASAAVQQAQTRYAPYGYNQGYNGQGYNGQGYNQGYAYNQRGYGIRVTAITNVERRSNGLRVRGLLDTGRGSGYGNQGYYGQGYNGQGYGNQAYASGDLSFRCTVDYRGYVSNVKIERNTGYRGY